MSNRTGEIIKNAFNEGWTTALITAASLSSLTCTVVASTGTVTRSAGSWITDGIGVGDIVTFGGFADSENNVAYTVVTVSALSLTGTTASAMKNVSGDTGVTAAPLTKNVCAGPGMMAQLRVNTSEITVTPKDGTTSLWGTVASTADFNCYCSPVGYASSLKLTFSADGTAWVFYKAAV